MILLRRVSFRKQKLIPVMATSDPKIPLIWLSTSIPLELVKLKANPTAPPPILPYIVETAALAAYFHCDPLTPYVLPLLKANQPHLHNKKKSFRFFYQYLISLNFPIIHHNTNKPMIALTGQPSGSGSIPWSYLPNLGPSIIAQARATKN